jgi:DNA end-binding protein Ku
MRQLAGLSVILEHNKNILRVESARGKVREKCLGEGFANRRNEPARFVLNPASVSGVPAHGPRANWKGFLRLSHVTCPVALYPATSESEKISFNQLNRKTGHRIEYAKVDADTGEEVENEDIVKGFKVDTDTYVEVTKEELENVALESTRTIEIDEFVDRSEIDPHYLIRPYYLRPDGKVGHDAFAVIRETI